MTGKDGFTQKRDDQMNIRKLQLQIYSLIKLNFTGFRKKCMSLKKTMWNIF